MFESENLVAIPSLGSLVEGWLLIVPRMHFISTGAFPPDLHEEFATFKREVCARLTALYGEICAFEHGPYAPSRQVGCGVDHAHVHLVPVAFDLITAAGRFARSNLNGDQHRGPPAVAPSSRSSTIYSWSNRSVWAGSPKLTNSGPRSSERRLLERLADQTSLTGASIPQQLNIEKEDDQPGSRPSKWARSTLAPADWRRSVKRARWIHEMAATTRKIADYERYPVAAMWLVDNHPRVTAHQVLPWFHSKSELSEQPKAAPRRKLTTARDHRIGNRHDWETLGVMAAGRHISVSSSRQSIRI